MPPSDRGCASQGRPIVFCSWPRRSHQDTCPCVTGHRSVAFFFFFFFFFVCYGKEIPRIFPPNRRFLSHFFCCRFHFFPFFLLYPIFNLFNFFVNYSQIGPSVFSNDFFFGCLKSKRTRLIQNLKKWKLSLKLKAKTFQKKFASQFNVVSFLWNSSTDLILSIPFFCLNQV